MRILFLFLFVSKYFFSQQFNLGYRDGWPIGYCYDAQYGCMAPPTPMAPFPRIGESSDSYLNGYHRGLSDGIEKGRIDRRQKNQSNINTYQSYGVPQYIPKYEPFTPDLNFYNQAMNQLQNNYNKKQIDKKENWFESEEAIAAMRNYGSKEEKEKRKNLMQFINTQYVSFSYFPKEIPDGFHRAHFINDTKFSWKYGSGQLDDCEVRDVFVQNNKIIWVSYKVYDQPREDFDCSVLPNNFNNKITITSGVINNGMCYVSESAIDKYKDPDFTQATDILSKNARYYFIEYLVKLRETNSLLDQIKIKYKNVNNKQLITNGWHVCYLSNRVDFCEIRNVYVQDKKIIKWIAGNGTECYVDSGGEIVDLKSTFSRKLAPMTDEMNEAQKKFWKNTSLSRQKTEIFDAFFINL